MSPRMLLQALTGSYSLREALEPESDAGNLAGSPKIASEALVLLQLPVLR